MSLDDEHEIWNTLPDFPEYAASNKGRIKRVTPDSRNHATRVLKPWIGNHGYEVVGLSKDGSIKRRLVHRLVCEAFHGPPPTEQHQVAHWDGSRTNHRADNLRWATRTENMADSAMHGTKATGSKHGRTTKPERTPRGEDHGHSKLTEEIVIEILNTPRTKGSSARLARWFNVSPATISMILSRKIWTHIKGDEK